MQNSMKVLISGICGFVGSHLARHLKESFENVSILGIDNLARFGSETNRISLKELGVQLYHGDIRVSSDVEILPTANWVIDAAAQPSVLAGRDGKTSSRQLLEHNLLGTINLLEYCRNFLFRRNSPIHKIFERSAELGVFRLTANKIAQIFGVRKHMRVRGKWHSTLEKLDHGHHVLRVYCKSLVARMYEKFETFLRLEICVNRLKDLGLNKGLENLNALRQKLVAVTDRFASFEAELLNVHVDFPLFQRLALPITCGRTKIPGIKIQDTRMIRLMEVLLHGGPQLHGWRTTQIREAILNAFGIHAEAYSLSQLRYDLRKMKAHGLLERDGRRYCYRLTQKRTKVAASFILFHKRICGPLANTLFDHRPQKTWQPAAKVEVAYHKADAAIQRLIDLVAA